MSAPQEVLTVKIKQRLLAATGAACVRVAREQGLPAEVVPDVCACEENEEYVRLVIYLKKKDA